MPVTTNPTRAMLATGDGEITGQDLRHAEFVARADLLIHDAQYTAEEYPAKIGWGHSSVEYVVKLGQHAGGEEGRADPSRSAQGRRRSRPPGRRRPGEVCAEAPHHSTSSPRPKDRSSRWQPSRSEDLQASATGFRDRDADQTGTGRAARCFSVSRIPERPQPFPRPFEPRAFEPCFSRTRMRHEH